MHCKTRENWPFSGIFFDFRVTLTRKGLCPKNNLEKFLGHPRACVYRSLGNDDVISDNKICTFKIVLSWRSAERFEARGDLRWAKSPIANR